MVLRKWAEPRLYMSTKNVSVIFVLCLKVKSESLYCNSILDRRPRQNEHGVHPVPQTKNPAASSGCLRHPMPAGVCTGCVSTEQSTDRLGIVLEAQGGMDPKACTKYVAAFMVLFPGF